MESEERDWINTTIGEQVTLQRGIDITRAEQRPGKVPVVSSGGVSSYNDTAAASGPGVVLGRKGIVGSVYFVASDYWPHDTTLWAKDFHGNNPRFVYYFFLWMAPQLARMDVGSANPTLNRNHVHPIAVRWPPVRQQRVIAEILGTLDDKIELNMQINRALEAMARAIFKAWFTDFEPVKAKATGATSFSGMPQEVFDQLPEQFTESELGPIPAGWRINPLSELVELLGGGTPKREMSNYWGGTIPWFSVRDAPTRGDVWVIDTEEHVTEAGVDNSSAKVMREGTTIISARGTVGRLALTAVPMAINQSCYGIQGVDGVGDFFAYFMVHYAVEELQQHTHGSVFDTITRRTFDALNRVRPQPKILDAFEEAVAPYLQHIQSNLFENRALARTRDALLPKLITGEIRVHSPQGIKDAS